MVAWGPQGVGVQTAGAGVLGAGHEGADLLDFTKDGADHVATRHLMDAEPGALEPAQRAGTGVVKEHLHLDVPVDDAYRGSRGAAVDECDQLRSEAAAGDGTEGLPLADLLLARGRGVSGQAAGQRRLGGALATGEGRPGGAGQGGPRARLRRRRALAGGSFRAP